MLYTNKIYKISELLDDAGVPLEERDTKDISVGGVIVSNLSSKIRISNTNPVVILLGRKEYKVEVSEEQAQ